MEEQMYEEELWEQFNRENPLDGASATDSKLANYEVRRDGRPFARFFQFHSAQLCADFGQEMDPDSEWEVIQ